MKKAIQRPYFSTFQMILLALFSALIVVAKITLRTPLQLSGHSGIFWMALMIVATKIVPQRGTASLVGITSGLLAAFLGVGDFGALNTILSYAVIGIGTEFALFLLPNMESVPQAALVGAIGHIGKLLVKWAIGAMTGAPIGFIALGLIRSIAGYIIFGALGGVLAALTLVALRRAGFFAYLMEKH
jgi:hypothetical protein